MQWRYIADGSGHGPVDDAAMLELARQGVIHDETPTMHEHATEWQPWATARADIPKYAAPAAVIPGARVIVTPVLVVVNLLVFVAMAVSGVSLFEPKIADLLRWGADFGPMTTQGQWWRVITATFVHIGIIHVLMNMFVLWSAGPIVERIFGSTAFAVLYLVAGIGGSLTSLAWRPLDVSAGASGAVFGIFGGLLGFLVLHGKSVDGTAVQALAKYAGTFLIYNLVYGLMQSRIDMAAHFGGLVAGFLVGLALAAAPNTAPGARLRRTLIAGIVSAACLVFAATRLPARSVLVGKNDEVRYTDRVKREQAEALARYLKKSGFFQDRGAIVELTKGEEGPTVSFMVKEGKWNDSSYIDSMEEFGSEIATAALGVPLKIDLLDVRGSIQRVIHINRKVLHVATKDEIYYEGSATEAEAGTLAHALQSNGFFSDKGGRITLSKGPDGTVVSLVVNEKAWNDPRYLKTAETFGHQIAPSVGGVPITFRLFKPPDFIGKIAGAKPESKDILIR